MQFYTILQQILILGLLAGVGILAIRTKILEASAKSVIEKLVFYITLPLLIITKLATLKLTPDILQNGLFVILATYFVLIVQILAGNLSAKLFKLKPPQALIHSMHTFLGNIVFLGFPLLDALFPGGEAILYAALYQLTMNTVLWTYGVSRLDGENQGVGLKRLKKLLNPNTVALLLGLMLMSFQIGLPEILQLSLGGLGRTTLYLAMIYIGILLSSTSLLKTLKKMDVLWISFNKLILLPVLLLFVLRYIIVLAGIPVNQLAFSVVIIEAAMPCMTILVILARRYGADDQKATENFVVSTIFSILTLPMIIYLLSHFNL